jgi:preprotein translocase subunit SecY
MIKTFFEKIRLIVKDKTLSKKILFILGAFVVFRLMAAIPVPGVNTAALEQFFNSNQFFGLLNILSGGGLSGLSIIMLGVGPYITASIIMQVMTMVSSRLKQLYHEEGEAGRRKFSQYSRLLTLPIAAIQGVGFLLFLQQQGIISILSPFNMIVNVVTIIAGSVLLMWVGELISEFGIGNGVSLIIFGGIVAGLPSAISGLLFTFEPAMIPSYIGFIFVGLVIVAAVVYITEAERPIPVTYAKQVRGINQTSGGVSTYIPIRLNQAGVIPIIFALSILLLPQLILSIISTFDLPAIQGAVSNINTLFANQVFHGVMYFVLVFLFTFFYTGITFEPDTMAENLQKSGAFIPGVRPGESTSKHVGHIVTRLTLVGALFLGGIAVLPVIVQGITGITSIAIGGTSLLIAVSVIIDLIKKTDSQISMREY